MSDKTIYDAARRSGMNRRDFVKFCTLAAAGLGLPAALVPQIVRALETKPRPRIYWLNFAACTCCTESLIKSSHPLIADALLGTISLDYMETIQVAAGHQAEKILWDGIEENAGKYVLAVEGSVPTKDGGVYCTVGGMTAIDYLHKAAADAKAVIAVGSCASFGCVTTAHPNPTGCKPIHKLVTGKPMVNLPGCPPIADALVGTILHLVAFDRLPELDSLNRPRVFYGQKIHEQCFRRAFFDSGMFAEKFDDDGARKGWCLYKLGCRGPITANACATVKWNDGVSFPIQSGHPCLGCSEPNYWDHRPMYEHITTPSIPHVGTADKIGKTLAIVTAAAAGIHLTASAVRKAIHKKTPSTPSPATAPAPSPAPNPNPEPPQET
jgi:hydrogenase small subunit